MNKTTWSRQNGINLKASWRYIPVNEPFIPLQRAVWLSLDILIFHWAPLVLGEETERNSWTSLIWRSPHAIESSNNPTDVYSYTRPPEQTSCRNEWREEFLKGSFRRIIEQESWWWGRKAECSQHEFQLGPSLSSSPVAFWVFMRLQFWVSGRNRQ